MTTRKDKIVFQKQVRQYHEHCCVPKCTASSKYNGLLSFHGFPSDPELRRRWLVSIRRDKFTVTPHSKVCSLHFTPDQLIQPKTAGGRRMLNKGAVPVLFPWNNYDHNYCSVPEPAGLDMAVSENAKLKEEIEALRKQIEELKIQSTFLQGFAGSDDDIRFYT
uniref:THAP domain-containing protein 1 n=1 Tax=Kryptolebias marmoratus TaxID=37003 RepID=A0A3Q2ZA89_KRYMA